VTITGRPIRLTTTVATAITSAAMAGGLIASTGASASADSVTTTAAVHASSPAAPANLVQNGCLTDPTFTDNGESLAHGSTKIAGWAIGGPDGVDVAGSGTNNPSPACPTSTWLYGPGGDAGSLSQGVTTKPGATYVLNWYDGNGPNAETLYVSWDGAVVAKVTPPKSANGSTISWTPGQALVTATSAKSVLSFSSANATGSEVVVGSVSLSLAPVANGFVASGLGGLYGTAEKQMLEKTPAHVVVKVSGKPVCVLQALSATQAKGGTGLQVAWTVAPTSQFVHATSTERQTAATTVYQSLVSLSTSSKNAYLAALKAGKAALQAQRMPVPGGNGLSNSWAVQVQSVSTSGKAMNFQITTTSAGTKATWANIPTVTSTSQLEAPMALATLLYYTKALASS
jgi:hypothetical protein